jgi:DNA-binding MarR family transcriptional regulator
LANGLVAGRGMDRHEDGDGGTSYRRLFRLALKVTHGLLSDQDRSFLDHLYDCPSQMDYLSKISRATRISYMTTKRCADRLRESGLVVPCRSDRSFAYFRLSEVGRMLIASSRERDREREGCPALGPAPVPCRGPHLALLEFAHPQAVDAGYVASGRDGVLTARRGVEAR